MVRVPAKGTVPSEETAGNAAPSAVADSLEDRRTCVNPRSGKAGGTAVVHERSLTVGSTEAEKNGIVEEGVAQEDAKATDASRAAETRGQDASHAKTRTKHVKAAAPSVHPMQTRSRGGNALILEAEKVKPARRKKLDLRARSLSNLRTARSISPKTARSFTLRTARSISPVTAREASWVTEYNSVDRRDILNNDTASDDRSGESYEFVSPKKKLQIDDLLATTIYPSSQSSAVVDHHRMRDVDALFAESILIPKSVAATLPMKKDQILPDTVSSSPDSGTIVKSLPSPIRCASPVERFWSDAPEIDLKKGIIHYPNQQYLPKPKDSENVVVSQSKNTLEQHPQEKLSVAQRAQKTDIVNLDQRIVSVAGDKANVGKGESAESPARLRFDVEALSETYAQLFGPSQTPSMETSCYAGNVALHSETFHLLFGAGKTGQAGVVSERAKALELQTAVLEKEHTGSNDAANRISRMLEQTATVTPAKKSVDLEGPNKGADANMNGPYFTESNNDISDLNLTEANSDRDLANIDKTCYGTKGSL